MIAVSRFTLALALAVALNACGVRTFETIITLGHGDLPLPVSLLDRTGLVVGIAESHEAGLEDGISRRDGGLVYLWVSGLCDEHVFLTLEAAADGYRLRARTEASRDVCRLAGVTRQIIITTAVSIEPGSVVVLEDQP